jgi:hypothetical protein
MPKEVMIFRMEGEKKKGRPRQDRPDKVEGSLRIKGIRNWHALARHWKEWRTIVLEDKVHNRMWCWRKGIRRREIEYYLRDRNLSRTHYA